MQGSAEGKQVGGQVSAAVAYHLLTACTAHKQTDIAAWLADLPLPFGQTNAPQTPVQVTASTPCYSSCTLHAFTSAGTLSLSARQAGVAKATTKWKEIIGT